MRTKLSIVLTFFFGVAYGQEYFPFPDTNAIWSVNIFKYAISGDTIINNIGYKKYYITTNDSTFSFDKAIYFAAVREDTTKKIWAIRDGSSIERLQYDFSLELGDTITITPIGGIDFWSGSITLELTGFDSILINQIYRKTYNLEGDYQPEKWIEGVGSMSGLFYPGIGTLGYADVGYPFLYCYEFENFTNYFTSDSICFDQFHGGAIETLSSEIQEHYFYPNPFTSYTILHINDFNSTILILDLFDITGQFIDSYEIIHNDFIINNFKYKPGLYYYRLKKENHTYGSGILMKQI